MDEVPAVPFRQEPHARESQDGVEAFADDSYLDKRDPSLDGATEGSSARHVQPVPSSDFPREPQLRSDFGAADDEWAAPKAPAAAGYDGAKPFAARSKTVTIDLQRLREGGMIAPDGDKT